MSRPGRGLARTRQRGERGARRARRLEGLLQGRRVFLLGRVSPDGDRTDDDAARQAASVRLVLGDGVDVQGWFLFSGEDGASCPAGPRQLGSWRAVDAVASEGLPDALVAVAAARRRTASPGTGATCARSSSTPRHGACCSSR